MNVQYVDKECSSNVDRRLEIEGVNPSSLRKSLKLCMIPVDASVPRFGMRSSTEVRLTSATVHHSKIVHVTVPQIPEQIARSVKVNPQEMFPERIVETIRDDKIT